MPLHGDNDARDHRIERRGSREPDPAEQRRRAAMNETALDAIIGIDANGLVNEWNPAAERTFGWTRDETLGKPMAEFIIPPEYRARHHAGFQRFLRTREAHVLGQRIEVPALRKDGARLTVELAITQLPLEGEPTFVAFLRDVTEERRLAQGHELLLRASALLGSSLDYEHTLRTLSVVLVPAFADWYAVDILGADGKLHRLETAHRDPERMRFARELAERYPDDPNSEIGVMHVLRTGKSEYASEISPELLERTAQSEDHLRLIRSLGLVSYIIVPLRAQERVIGVMSLVTAESGRRYDERDLALAEDLARRAGQAIENARLFSEVRETRELLEQQATELEAQAQELEHTAMQLEMSNEELRDTNEELAKRTHEAERAREEADRARHDADVANRAKSEFLAAMSHELRTPLNAIVGYAELMEVGVHGTISNEQQLDLRRIQRSADHLLGLITDILNFAKIESGRLRYEIAPTPLLDVLSAVEDLIRPQAAAKSIAYALAPGTPAVYVVADHEKLLQVFVNLLSNAVRFTEPGGRIDVSVEVRDDRVLTHVRDTGIGIPTDKIESVFEPFVQVGRAYVGEREGTGLGLAISRELARGMGGELTATSTVGVGSTFTVTLRRAASGIRPFADRTNTAATQDARNNAAARPAARVAQPSASDPTERR